MNHDLQTEIIATYRGWDALEKSLYGSEIIDFDLTRIKKKKDFFSRSEILKNLEELQSETLVSDWVSEFASKRLKASIFYLRACLGEVIPFSEYIENTLGIIPEIFPDSYLDKSLEKLNLACQNLGFEYSSVYKEKYESICVVQDDTLIRNNIESNIVKWAEKLDKYVTISCKKPISISFTSVDAYWANWTSGSLDNGFLLKINLHPRIKYSRGSLSMLALHEYCAHLIQGMNWLELSAHGKLDDVCSFTTVHGPETFLTEGLAESLSYALIDNEDELDFHELLSQCLMRYKNLVNHNVHYMINQGCSFNEVMNYCKARSPFDSDIKIEKEIQDRSLKPLNRVYQFVYGVSQDYFLEKFVDFDEVSKRKCLLSLYQRPYTKSQLDVLMSSIKSFTGV